MTLVSASWDFDPQAAGGDEVVGECVPERMSLGLDQPADGKKTKAVLRKLALERRGRTGCPPARA